VEHKYKLCLTNLVQNIFYACRLIIVLWVQFFGAINARCGVSSSNLFDLGNAHPKDIVLRRLALNVAFRYWQAVPYQPNSGPPKMLPRGPLMVIYKKKLRYATSRGWIDLKPKYSNCKLNFGTTRPVARFWGLGGKNTFLLAKDFNCYRMFETTFSENNKIWGGKNVFGLTAAECPPCLRAWAKTSPKSLPLGNFMFVQEG